MIVAQIAPERPSQPYPGLRPFETQEWSIFFGRERMVDDVIDRLARDRLVVVHGASGSGKSSLIRAGVLPKLARQHLRHGAPWLTCAMRPSGGPLWNLASEFAKLEDRGDDLDRIQAIHGLFSRRDATLASVVGASEALSDKSLCVLVDQFEELFRYEKETSREEAELFVDLISRVAVEPDGAPSQDTAEVHVVVTMRSEFLGECARFDGLAETINRTQYLVPRMDDESLLRAVRRPAQMYNGFIDDALAVRLIASVRGREDELPLLQHGLMLMWDKAACARPGERIVLDGAIVEKAGGLAELLSRHADAVMASVAPDERRARLVETIFRELTDPLAEGTAIRRPRALLDLAAVAGVPPDELHPLIDAFRAPGVSFLTPYAPAPLTDRTVVDVSHEALVRCWHRIASGQDGWLKREFDDGLAWRSLLVEARAFAKNSARVLSAAATEDRSKLFAERGEFWSKRYGGGRRLVDNLLEASRNAAVSARRKATVFAASLTVLTIAAVSALGIAIIELQKAQTAEVAAKTAAADAVSKKADAVAEAEKARAALADAETARTEAEAQRQNAEVRRREAEAARTEAETERREAEAEKTKADQHNELSRMFFSELTSISKSHRQGKSAEEELFEKTKIAAEKGNSVAANILGILYDEGLGTERDYAKARDWYVKAANAGVARAMYDIGILYDYGHGVPQDHGKAREWYEKAANAGEPMAFTALGELYEGGKVGPQEYQIAREWYEKAVDAGDPRAMSHMGFLYESGHGVPQDYGQAREWYEKAAATGEATGMVGVGFLYYNGKGVSQDYTKAHEWFEKAASLGNEFAMFSIGVLYNDGRGVPLDYKIAFEWFQKAADAGVGSAMNSIGKLYELGTGVAADYGKAREWYEKAATAGETMAMRNIAGLYEDGHGVPQDYAQALDWYQRAAAAGDTLAMMSVGFLYESGRGVAQDDQQAREWYVKAATAGDTFATRLVSGIDFKVRLKKIRDVGASGRYKDALRQQADLTEEIEADEVKTNNKPGDRTVGALVSLSWYALFARDFPRALAAAERGHSLAPENLDIETNRAHALMFLDRAAEARILYLQHRNDTISQNDKPWRQVIAEDFAEFRKAGLDNPLMGEIESALVAKLPIEKR